MGCFLSGKLASIFHVLLETFHKLFSYSHFCHFLLNAQLEGAFLSNVSFQANYFQSFKSPFSDELPIAFQQLILLVSSICCVACISARALLMMCYHSRMVTSIFYFFQALLKTLSSTLCPAYMRGKNLLIQCLLSNKFVTIYCLLICETDVLSLLLLLSVRRKSFLPYVNRKRLLVRSFCQPPTIQTEIVTCFFG